MWYARPLKQTLRADLCPVLKRLEPKLNYRFFKSSYNNAKHVGILKHCHSFQTKGFKYLSVITTSQQSDSNIKFAVLVSSFYGVTFPRAAVMKS